MKRWSGTACGVVVLIGCGSSRPDGTHEDANLGDHGDARLVDGPGPGRDGPGGGGQPARIEMYSGDGAMAMMGWPGGDALKAIVLDGNGTPVPEVAVTWQVTGGDIAITGSFQTGAIGTVMTDALGIARVGIRGAFESQPVSVWASTIRASIAAGHVDFHAFTTYYTQQIPTLPATYIVTPQGRDLGTHAAGSVIPGAVVGLVVYQAGDQQGRGAVGAGMRFVTAVDPGGDTPTELSCANATVALRTGGTVYTDTSGRASCDLKVPATPGNYQIGIRLAGVTDFIPYVLTVQ